MVTRERYALVVIAFRAKETHADCKRAKKTRAYYTPSTLATPRPRPKRARRRRTVAATARTTNAAAPHVVSGCRCGPPTVAAKPRTVAGSRRVGVGEPNRSSSKPSSSREDPKFPPPPPLPFRSAKKTSPPSTWCTETVSGIFFGISRNRPREKPEGVGREGDVHPFYFQHSSRQRFVRRRVPDEAFHRAPGRHQGARENPPHVFPPDFPQLALLRPLFVVHLDCYIQRLRLEVVPVLHPTPEGVPLRAVGDAAWELLAVVHLGVPVRVRRREALERGVIRRRRVYRPLWGFKEKCQSCMGKQYWDLGNATRTFVEPSFASHG